jgi:hypothetical protein
MNKSLPSRFTVSIPVKPYVKRFLDINFGLPVDFTQNAHAHKHFQSLFKNPNTSQDKKYPDHICTYTELVEVVISEHDFYRYGWELTKTNTIAFGRYYEERAKAMMRTYIGVNISLGLPINKSILKFQNRFVFEEEVWHYEAIKKDLYRNGKVELIDFNDEIFKKIEKIVLRNLYDLGTLSQQAIKEYETTE